jgi:hypothetical protein
MNATPTDLENSIQLALEAAAAANDSAEDVARLSADTQAAADRLDGFAKVMKPVMMGVVAGAVLAIGLGGLVYLRTLSDMRTATATQTEALTVFSKSVADLQAQLDALDGVNETLAALGPAQAAGFDDLRATLEAQFTEMQIGLSDAASDEANPATTPQMLRSLSQSMQESHAETRADFAAGLSDLQLALTRMLADRPVVQKTQSAAAAPSKPAPVRRARPAPRPEPNPFSFP